jgi:DNA-binding response OmpR family regulator
MKARILLIDDEPALRDLFKALLEAQGHEVAIAEHGRAAMEILRQQPFDLVMTDVLMPEQDGIETIVQIRSHWPKLRVLAMTGGGHLDAHYYLRVAKNLGATSLLQKPFSADELLHAIRGLLTVPATI